MIRFRYIAEEVPARTIQDPATGLDVGWKNPDPDKQFIAYDRMGLPHTGATASAAVSSAKREDAHRRRLWASLA